MHWHLRRRNQDNEIELLFIGTVNLQINQMKDFFFIFKMRLLMLINVKF